MLRTMRWVGHIALLLALVLVAPTARAQADPTSIVRSYVAALNRGDLDGALALLTDDFTLSGVLGCPEGRGCAGKAAVRPELARRIAAHQQITILTAQSAGNTVVARVEVRADDIRAPAVQRIILFLDVTIRGDKLAAINSRPDRDDSQTAAFFAPPASPTPPPASTQPLPTSGAPGPPALAALGLVLVLLGWGLRTLADWEKGRA